MFCGWGVKAGMVYFAGKTVWYMSEHIRGSYDDALYKSTYTLKRARYVSSIQWEMYNLQTKTTLSTLRRLRSRWRSSIQRRQSWVKYIDRFDWHTPYQIISVWRRRVGFSVQNTRSARKYGIVCYETPRLPPLPPPRPRRHSLLPHEWKFAGSLLMKGCIAGVNFSWGDNVTWHRAVESTADGCHSANVAVTFFGCKKCRSADSRCFSVGQKTPKLSTPVGGSRPI